MLIQQPVFYIIIITGNQITLIQVTKSGRKKEALVEMT